MISLHDTLTAARERLIAAGIPPADAAADVELFARTILGWDRARLLLSRSAAVPDVLEPQFSAWIARRQAHEPTAYIVGIREFWGLELRVTPSVLVPRPETEFIVEEALRLVRTGAVTAGRPAAAPAAARTPERERSWRDSSLQLADVGTGSGCIAIALATELPHCTVIASDVSEEALVIARGNAGRHGVDARVTFVRTSYLDGNGGPFDLIAANPPYVRERDKPALARDVRHEPDVALFGGDSGLQHIRGVLDAAVAVLRPGGWLVMEFGFGQEDAVRALTTERRALRLEKIREDLQGIPRTAVIQRMDGLP